ncbi:hypothetical protein S83_065325 [Arachis hypogaea]
MPKWTNDDCDKLRKNIIMQMLLCLQNDCRTNILELAKSYQFTKIANKKERKKNEKKALDTPKERKAP